MDNKKRIFVGCAGETRSSIAEPISKRLGEKGFQVDEWWEGDVFAAGDVTLQRLFELTGEVDGAVFICVATDQSLRGKSVRHVPRDNVIFELGMFLSRLGLGRCVVVTDQKTDLPSDLNGVTSISLAEGDVLSTANRIVRHFKDQFGEAQWKGQYKRPEVYIIETDPHIMEVTFDGRIPHEWNTRALFFGIEGALNWLAIDKQTAYLAKKDKEAMGEQLLGVVDQIRAVDGVEFIPACVSLGPGSAEADRQLVKHMSSVGAPTRYVPVDISDGLLNHACYLLHDCAEVPFGILTDFEESMTFIESRLAGRIGRPALFTLLGNAFGNLDNKEKSFMEQIQGLLRAGDYLVLEVAIKYPGWEWKKDMRYNLSKHTTEMQHFYARGLARRINEGVRSIVNAYTQRITVKEGDSNVPWASSIDYVDTRQNLLIASLRRYQWRRLLDWLRVFDFSIVASKRLKLKEDGNVGIGTVLLRKT